jgi:hypothetical protein
MLLPVNHRKKEAANKAPIAESYRNMGTPSKKERDGLEWMEMIMYLLLGLGVITVMEKMTEIQKYKR